jgi:DNA-3-methyladenine glycosylase
MFGTGGHAYVYFVYGMHYQFNVVANVEGIAHAVLIRALQPVEGIEWIQVRRGEHKETNLTNGPGKLCQALGIDLSLNKEDLLGDRIWIEKNGLIIRDGVISSGPRVGIDYAEEFIQAPWRFWITGNPFVSKAPRKQRESAKE